MNKLIIGLVLALLLLSTAGIGVAADNKPDNAPPDVQKITFVHYAKSADNSKTEWDEEVDVYKLLPSKVKWYDTVEYEIYADGSGLNKKNTYDAISESLQTWDAETSFDLFAKPKWMEGQASVTPGELDGKNIVVWNDLGSSGIIAMNTFWFYRATGEIVDSDVEFNTYYEWSTTGETNKMDLQNIATHEFGHNGLNDLYITKCTELTMYGYSGYGETKKQTLGTGDISGIQALYGE